MFYLPLKKALYCSALLWFLPAHLSAKPNTNSTQVQTIEALHRRAEDLVNYDPDSSLVLLEIAERKIKKLKDKKVYHALKAENNLYKADYWVGKDLERATTLLHLALSYYRKHPKNKQLGEAFLLKGMLIKSQMYNPNVCIISDALFYYDTALTYALKSNDLFLCMAIYYEQANALQQSERWQESYEKARLSVKAAEKSGDSLAMSASYFILSKTYNHFNLYESAERCLRKSIAYGKDTYQIADLTGMLGTTLTQNKKYTEAISQYQNALNIILERKNYFHALRICSKMGETYLLRKEKPQAIKVFELMDSLRTFYKGNDAAPYLFYARMHILLNQKEEAKREVEAFIARYKSSVVRAAFIDSYKEVGALYTSLGDHKKAAHFYEKWGSLKDSLHTYTNKLHVSGMESMYLKELAKNKEISSKNTALQQSKTQQATMGGILIFVILLGGGLIYYIRMKSMRKNQALQGKQLEQLMEAQESERQRLARELHDGVGQSLAALKMQLQLDNDLHTSLNTVNKVEALCKEVRTLSHQMMPVALKENGLPAALQHLLESSFSKTEMEIDLLTHGISERLAPNVEVHLYRIMQELITNILKHAKATKVGVQLLQRGNQLLLIVEDNGKGFSLQQGQAGMGLANIRSRLEALSGKVKIQSSKTNGTYIRIAIPILAKSNKQTA